MILLLILAQLKQCFKQYFMTIVHMDWCRVKLFVKIVSIQKSLLNFHNYTQTITFCIGFVSYRFFFSL